MAHADTSLLDPVSPKKMFWLSRLEGWALILKCKRSIVLLRLDRHPLQELTVPSFVANDTFLRGGQGSQRSRSSSTDAEQEVLLGELRPNASIVTAPSMLMLTGPNYSGKSVMLKQVINLDWILIPMLITIADCFDCLYGSYWKVITVKSSFFRSKI